MNSRSSFALRAALALASLLAAMPGAHAQRMTEMFIPIGQSPGVDALNSVRGTVDAVDASRRTITVDDLVVRVPRDAPVWIDRSAQGASNSVADFSAIRRGASVEVMFADPEARDEAQWVKVRAGS